MKTKIKTTDITIDVIKEEKLMYGINNHKYIKIANKKLNNKVYDVYCVKTQEKGEDPVYSYILFDFVDSLPIGFKETVEDVLRTKEVISRVYDNGIETSVEKIDDLLYKLSTILDKESLNVTIGQGYTPLFLDNDFTSYQDCIDYVLHVWDGIDIIESEEKYENLDEKYFDKQVPDNYYVKKDEPKIEIEEEDIGSPNGITIEEISDEVAESLMEKTNNPIPNVKLDNVELETMDIHHIDDVLKTVNDIYVTEDEDDEDTLSGVTIFEAEDIDRLKGDTNTVFKYAKGIRD